MRKLIVFAKAFGLVAAVLVPPSLAVLQLGLGLSAVDRMHARNADRPPVRGIELINERIDVAGSNRRHIRQTHQGPVHLFGQGIQSNPE